MGTACSKPSAIKTRSSDPPPHQQKPVAVATEKTPVVTESAPPKKQEDVHPLPVSDKEATEDTEVNEDSGDEEEEDYENDDDDEYGGNSELKSAIKDINADPTNHHRWYYVGKHLISGETARVNNVKYSPPMCLMKALEIDPNYADVWHYICTFVDKPTLMINGKKYTHAQCCVKALEIDSDNPETWSCLGDTIGNDKGTVTVSGKVYTKAECYIKAQECGEDDSVEESDEDDAEDEVSPDDDEEDDDDDEEVNSSEESEEDHEDDDEEDVHAKYVAHYKLTSAIWEVNADPTNHHRWYYVGSNMKYGETATVNNVKYTPRQCILKVLEIDPNYADAWRFLGNTLIRPLVNVNTLHYTKGQCYIKALEINPDDSETWTNLVDTMIYDKKETVTVSGKVYTKAECQTKAQECGTYYTKQGCYIRALEIDPEDAEAWRNVSSTMCQEDVVTISGKPYSKAECCVQALEINPGVASTWCTLGTCGFLESHVVGSKMQTVTVSGKPFTELECYVQSLEVCSDYEPAWSRLSCFIGIYQTTATVKGELFDVKMSAVKALELNASNVEMWRNLHVYMKRGDTVTIKGEKYTRDECKEKDQQLTDSAIEDLENDPEFASSWCDLAATMFRRRTVTVSGKPYTKEECCVRSLEATRDDRDHHAVAWRYLGIILLSGNSAGGSSTVTVNGEKYTDRECFAMSIEAREYAERYEDEEEGGADWFHLGTILQRDGSVVVIDDEELNAQECLARAVDEDEENLDFWKVLSATLEEGSSDAVSGKYASYNFEDCQRRIMGEVQWHAIQVEKDINSSEAWNALGTCLFKEEASAVVSGKHYSRQDCFVKAVEINSGRSHVWIHLGDTITDINNTGLPTVTVNGKPYTKLACYIQAVESDPANSQFWSYLADIISAVPSSLTVTVSGKPYTKQECYIRSLEISSVGGSWFELCSTMAENDTVTINDKHYTVKDCIVNSLEFMRSFARWLHLGTILQRDGSVVTVAGKEFNAQRCFVETLKFDFDDDYCAPTAWKALVSTMKRGDTVMVNGKVRTYEFCLNAVTGEDEEDEEDEDY